MFFNFSIICSFVKGILFSLPLITSYSKSSYEMVPALLNISSHNVFEYIISKVTAISKSYSLNVSDSTNFFI